MAKTRFERNAGFGPLGLLFLAAVLYLFVSLAIGWVTKDETHCNAGFDREWRYAPPAGSAADRDEVDRWELTTGSRTSPTTWARRTCGTRSRTAPGRRSTS